MTRQQQQDRRAATSDAHQPARHLMVNVRDGAGVHQAFRLLDVTTDYPPLLKELLWHGVAERPGLAGTMCEITIRQGGHDSVVCQLLAGSGHVLFSHEVPFSSFGWVAESLVKTVTPERGASGFSYSVTVVPPDHPLVQAWKDACRTPAAEQGWEIHDEGTQVAGPVQFPARDLFELSPSCNGGWAAEGRRFSCRGGAAQRLGPLLTCCFHRQAFQEYSESARREQHHERHWLGLGRVLIDPPKIRCIIESLQALPGSASEAGIYMSGRALHGILTRRREAVVAYLHLHPSQIRGMELALGPSGPDATTFWDLDTRLPTPLVFPIMRFGSSSSEPPVQVYGYSQAVLQLLPLEISDE